MMCRACGHEKTQVMRTNDFGIIIMRYRECLNPNCKKVFQTAEEEFGAVQSTLDMCKVVEASRDAVMQIKMKNQESDGVKIRGTE